MILVNVPIEVENQDVVDYLNCYIGEKDPTDLDSEAEKVSLEIIRGYYLAEYSDGYAFFDEEKLKQEPSFKELKAQVKRYIHLKRHEPNTFEKLYKEANGLL